jgi:hypothetical protein
MHFWTAGFFMTNICVQGLSQFGGMSVLKLQGAGLVFSFSFSGFLFLNAVVSSRPSREPGLVASLASPSNGFLQ